MHVVRTIRLISHALLFGGVAHALANQRFCFGVQRQGNAERSGGALARVVVGCGADTAGREHHTAGSEGACQGGRDALRRVSHVICPVELQTAYLQ